MKRSLLIISLIIISFVLLPFKNYADQVGEEVKLYLGEVKVFSVSNPTRIVIGNPNIADVSSVTRDEITLNPKAQGKTTLFFWDSFGEQSYIVRVFSEDIAEVKYRIDSLLAKLNLPEVYTKAEEAEGKVILLGRVKKPQEREKIALALARFKDKIMDFVEVREEEKAIEIDVQVLELDKDATETLGLEYPASFAISSDGVADGSIYATAVTGWKKLFIVRDWSRTSFYWKLDALIQEGKARVLSRPRLACQSGKEAELLVGGEKPIFTTSVQGALGAASTSVDYKEYGIKLKIKPEVKEGNNVKLALNVEVSEVGAAEVIGAINAPTAKAYPLTKRTTSTELFMQSGNTMAIGGLIRQKTTEDVRRVPFFSKIPILGMAFRHRTSTTGGGQGERGDVELFITLTPTIMSSDVGSAKENKIDATKKEDTKQTATVSPKATEEDNVKEAKVGSVKKEEGEQTKTAPVATDKEESRTKIDSVKKVEAQQVKAVSPVGVTNIPNPLTMYASVIQQKILRNLSYPALARQGGFQGAVKLGLHLSYRGELLGVTVKSSSGNKILDDNALAVAKGIASYPPFPPAIKQNDLWLDIPIVYRLN